MKRKESPMTISQTAKYAFHLAIGFGMAAIASVTMHGLYNRLPVLFAMLAVAIFFATRPINK
jgi:flagellar biosynthesis protein FliR